MGNRILHVVGLAGATFGMLTSAWAGDVSTLVWAFAAGLWCLNSWMRSK